MSNGFNLTLHPIEMTVELMKNLEKRNLIIRLSPDSHNIATQVGTTDVETLYVSEERYGPHKLLVVSVNRTSLASFATHPANEEFLLIGEKNTKPLVLVIAFCSETELKEKIASHSLGCADFVAIRVKFNDPEVSFFTMLRGVPHGEAILDGEGKPSKFYVTEPRDLTVDLIDFGPYVVSIDDEKETQIAQQKDRTDQVAGKNEGEKKGFVQLECHNGAWWFVDPFGERFISLGINHIEPQHMMGPYNLERTRSIYGDDFVDANGAFNPEGDAVKRWLETVKGDLKAWGFNTIAYHTKVPLENLKDAFFVMERIRFVRLETYNAPVARPDIFADDFEKELDSYIFGICMKWKDEKNLLGYAYSDTAEWMIGNGPYLAHCYEPVPVIYPWVSAICSMERNAPGKIRWVEILKNHYGSARLAGKGYGIDADTWDQLLDAKIWDAFGGGIQKEMDNQAMLGEIAERWFSLHEKYVRKYDPRHLILGEKLNGNLPIPDFLLQALKAHVDVINIQWYGRYEEQVDALRRINEITGKPILLGDSSFAAVQPNQKDSKGVLVATQEDVGLEYQDYLTKIMRLPFIVGWHYCGYMEGWEGLEKYEVYNPFTVTNPLCSTQCGFKDPFEKTHEEAIGYVIRANRLARDLHNEI